MNLNCKTLNSESIQLCYVQYIYFLLSYDHGERDLWESTINISFKLVAICIQRKIAIGGIVKIGDDE
jgi:hypothetical protein